MTKTLRFQPRLLLNFCFSFRTTYCLFVLFSCLCIAPQGKAQFFMTQYFDGADTVYDNSVNIVIEGSENNIWQIGPPQKTVFNMAATAPNAILTDSINNYPPNNSSAFQAHIYNQLAPWGILAMQWMQKLDFDSLDGGHVQFSTDQGLSWQEAHNNPYVYNYYGYQPANLGNVPSGAPGFVGKDSTWRNIWLCFDMSWMSLFPDTLRFRYVFESDTSATNAEGWMIDNFTASITVAHTLKDPEQVNYIDVGPIPTSGKLNISTQKIQDFHIIEQLDVFDLEGRLVEQYKNVPTKFWIDMEQYPAGTYNLVVKTNLRTERFKVIVQH